MLQFVMAIPELVLYGCGILVVLAVMMSIALFWRTRRVGSSVDALSTALKAFGAGTAWRRGDGLTLAELERIRGQCEKLGDVPGQWWKALDSDIEQYTNPQDVDGWFLTEKPREVLSYEVVIGK